jgi:hypothetical protein
MAVQGSEFQAPHRIVLCGCGLPQSGRETSNSVPGSLLILCSLLPRVEAAGQYSPVEIKGGPLCIVLPERPAYFDSRRYKRTGAQ